MTLAIIPLPETVVIAKRLITGLWAAKIMASASSWPGSQSRTIGVGFTKDKAADMVDASKEKAAELQDSAAEKLKAACIATKKKTGGDPEDC